jgi:hypothetical protein
MKNLYVGLILGGAGLITLAAIIKRKPSRLPSMMSSPTALPGPKVYMPAQGDLPSVVFARFGTTQVAMQAANGTPAVLTLPGKPIKLPPGVADLGSRPKAQGNAQ